MQRSSGNIYTGSRFLAALVATLCLSYNVYARPLVECTLEPSVVQSIENVPCIMAWLWESCTRQVNVTVLHEDCKSRASDVISEENVTLTDAEVIATATIVGLVIMIVATVAVIVTRYKVRSRKKFRRSLQQSAASGNSSLTKSTLCDLPLKQSVSGAALEKASATSST